MKLLNLLLSLLMLTAVSAHADGDDDEIQNCLKAWGKHPFAKHRPEFRTISSKVRVMGIGSNVEDTHPTEKPELVLIKPAVSVMSKTIMELKNPNGWYCLKGKVDVMGKTIINLACKGHMASSTGNVAVLGSNKEDKGVTVMGKSVVNRECSGSELAKAAADEEKKADTKAEKTGEKKDFNEDAKKETKTE